MVKIEVVVDNRLRLRRSDLDEDAERDVVAAFTYPNPEHGKKRALGFSTHATPTHLTTCEHEGDLLTLPRGGTQKLRAALAMHGLAPRFVDRRLSLPFCEMPRLRLELRPYQRDAIERMAARENCLLRAPTGSGKTVTAMGLIARLGQPALVVVWSSNLLAQWRDRLARDFGLRDRDIGLVRGSARRIRPITLAMQQTLWARGVVGEISQSFGLVLCDEVQRFAARTCRDVIDAFPARYRFGVSADHTRKDGLDFLTTDLFGAPAADIPLEQLVEDGSVHDVEVRVVPTSFRADWYGSGGTDTFDFNRLLDEMTHDAARDALVADLARSSVANGHPTLVFTHRVEHARRLADEVFAGEGCGLLIGGAENAVRFEEDRSRLLDGRIKLAVGTVQAIGQGLDLPSVARGIASTPIAGNRQLFGQVRGRICRPAKGKRDAALVYLWDRHVYPQHLRNLLAWNSAVRVLDRGEWADGQAWYREHRAELVGEECAKRRGTPPRGSPMFDDR